MPQRWGRALLIQKAVPAQQHGANLGQCVSRCVSVEITNPVVEIEEMKFEMMLLLLAFSPACIYIGPFLGIC